MKGDFVIDACRWHVDAEDRAYKARALDHFRDSYTVLLNWMRSEGLLKRKTFGLRVSNWMRFELNRSDLTADGFELMRRAMKRWNPSYGQAGTERHLVQWKRRLKMMRSEFPVDKAQARKRSRKQR